MDVTIITVAYHSFAVLPAMAASLPPGVRLVVVDNGDDDGLRGWAAGRGGVRLIVAPGNRGFGAACNLGAATAESGLLLFLNPDAQLLPGCLAALLAAAGRWPAAAAFGPLLIDAGGRAGHKGHTALAPLDRFGPGVAPQAEAEVPVLSGAALLVRRAAFAAVGGFDPALFLYYEDDDLCLRLRAAAGPLVLVPGAQVRHSAGHSTARSPGLARLRGYHLMRSYMLAARKHGLPLPLLTGLIGSLRFALSRPGLFSATGRAHAAGRLAGLWAMRRRG